MGSRFAEALHGAPVRGRRINWVDRLRVQMDPESFADLVAAIENPDVGPKRIHRAIVALGLEDTPRESSILNGIREIRERSR